MLAICLPARILYPLQTQKAHLVGGLVIVVRMSATREWALDWAAFGAPLPFDGSQ
jgi:hypothetical protein